MKERKEQSATAGFFLHITVFYELREIMNYYKFILFFISIPFIACLDAHPDWAILDRLLISLGLDAVISPLDCSTSNVYCFQSNATERTSPPRSFFTGTYLPSLSGTIPTDVGGLTALEELNIKNAGGTIPSELGLSSVEVLTISASPNHVEQLGPKISGTIPTELFNSRLKQLQLARIDVFGNVPSEIGLASNLEFLTMSYLPLMTGTLPSEIFDAQKLLLVTFNGIPLTGTVPTEITTVSSLKFFIMSNTRLGGELPADFNTTETVCQLGYATECWSCPVPSSWDSCFSEFIKPCDVPCVPPRPPPPPPPPLLYGIVEVAENPNCTENAMIADNPLILWPMNFLSSPNHLIYNYGSEPSLAGKSNQKVEWVRDSPTNKYNGFSARFIDHTFQHAVIQTMARGVFIENDYTLELWMKCGAVGACNTSSNDYPLMSFSGLSGTGNGILMYLRDDGLIQYTYATNFNVWPEASSYLKDGEWHHLAVVRIGGNFLVYADGEQVASKVGNVQSAAPIKPYGCFCLGQEIDNPYSCGGFADTQEYYGSMALAAVYTYALDAERLRLHYEGRYQCEPYPTASPTDMPSLSPTEAPTDMPTSAPTKMGATSALLVTTATTSDANAIGATTTEPSDDATSADSMVEGSGVDGLVVGTAVAGTMACLGLLVVCIVVLSPRRRKKRKRRHAASPRGAASPKGARTPRNAGSKRNSRSLANRIELKDNSSAMKSEYTALPSIASVGSVYSSSKNTTNDENGYGGIPSHQSDASIPSSTSEEYRVGVYVPTSTISSGDYAVGDLASDIGDATKKEASSEYYVVCTKLEKMSHHSAAATARLLRNQLRATQRAGTHGFMVELFPDEDLFRWRVWLEGPSETPYEGGVFELELAFPVDFPMMPPTLTFISEFWHPNVFHNGGVCISILHPPVHDPMSDECLSERWRPTQTVTTILLSVMSMLADPNFSSPANIDASIEMRRNPWEFKRRVARIVERANDALPSHVHIPHPDTDVDERDRLLAKKKAIEEAQHVDFDMEFDADEDMVDAGSDVFEAEEDDSAHNNDDLERAQRRFEAAMNESTEEEEESDEEKLVAAGMLVAKHDVDNDVSAVSTSTSALNDGHVADTKDRKREKFRAKSSKADPDAKSAKTRKRAKDDAGRRRGKRRRDNDAEMEEKEKENGGDTDETQADVSAGTSRSAPVSPKARARKRVQKKRAPANASASPPKSKKKATKSKTSSTNATDSGADRDAASVSSSEETVVEALAMKKRTSTSLLPNAARVSVAYDDDSEFLGTYDNDDESRDERDLAQADEDGGATDRKNSSSSRRSERASSKSKHSKSSKGVSELSSRRGVTRRRSIDATEAQPGEPAGVPATPLSLEELHLTRSLRTLNSEDVPTKQWDITERCAHYDKKQARWCALTSARARGGEPTTKKRASQSSRGFVQSAALENVRDRLRILTFNVLDSAMSCGAVRLPFIVQTLREADADIICLQEATPALLGALLAEQWVCDSYTVCDAFADRLGVLAPGGSEDEAAALLLAERDSSGNGGGVGSDRGRRASLRRLRERVRRSGSGSHLAASGGSSSGENEGAKSVGGGAASAAARVIGNGDGGGGLLVLSRVQPRRVVEVEMASRRVKHAMLLEFDIASGGDEKRSLGVCCVHLDGGALDCKLREAQLEQCFALLAPFDDAVLAGDWMFGEASRENSLLPFAYKDVWVETHKADGGANASAEPRAGFTVDTTRNALCRELTTVGHVQPLEVLHGAAALMAATDAVSNGGANGGAGNGGGGGGATAFAQLAGDLCKDAMRTAKARARHTSKEFGRLEAKDGGGAELAESRAGLEVSVGPAVGVASLASKRSDRMCIRSKGAYWVPQSARLVGCTSVADMLRANLAERQYAWHLDVLEEPPKRMKVSGGDGDGDGDDELSDEHGDASDHELVDGNGEEDEEEEECADEIDRETRRLRTLARLTLRGALGGNVHAPNRKERVKLLRSLTRTRQRSPLYASSHFGVLAEILSPTADASRKLQARLPGAATASLDDNDDNDPLLNVNNFNNVDNRRCVIQ